MPLDAHRYADLTFVESAPPPDAGAGSPFRHAGQLPAPPGLSISWRSAEGRGALLSIALGSAGTAAIMWSRLVARGERSFDLPVGIALVFTVFAAIVGWRCLHVFRIRSRIDVTRDGLQAPGLSLPVADIVRVIARGTVVAADSRDGEHVLLALDTEAPARAIAQRLEHHLDLPRRRGASR